VGSFSDPLGHCFSFFYISSGNSLVLSCKPLISDSPSECGVWSTCLTNALQRRCLWHALKLVLPGKLPLSPTVSLHSSLVHSPDVLHWPHYAAFPSPLHPWTVATLSGNLLMGFQRHCTCSGIKRNRFGL
jgi:hypothetical protein